MTDKLKKLEEESKIRKKLEKIEMLINTTPIVSEKYTNKNSNNNSFYKVEIYR